MRIIFLGSGGYMPSTTRHTACYLVDTGSSLIIIDAGTGICRLGEHLDTINKYEEVNIILSHYHLDHIVGIFYLFNWHLKKINFFGPGEIAGFKSCKSALSEIIGPPYCPNINTIAKEVKFFDYDMNGFNLNNYKIGITKQNHPGSSFGITLGNILHYATDTTPLYETFKKSEKTSLLLHDCWSVSDTDNAHGSLKEIIEMIKNYRINKVGLIHINPNITGEEINTINNLIKSYPEIFIAEDQMIINL